jgi:hypothetical protein
MSPANRLSDDDDASVSVVVGVADATLSLEVVEVDDDMSASAANPLTGAHDPRAMMLAMAAAEVIAIFMIRKEV